MRSHVYCFNRQQPDEQGTLTAIPLRILAIWSRTYLVAIL